MHIGLYVQYYFSDFNENLNFLNIFSKNTQVATFIKSVHWNRVVPCGRTDMTKLIDKFHKLANAPKNNPTV
jgi:hypothetical protein